MQFTPQLNEKIKNGDALTDTELQVACDHFEALVAMLSRSGPEWGIARFSAIWEANRLHGYREARKADKRFRPAQRGMFDVNYRDGAYRVTLPNYDGGKVVTLEHHEAAVAEARLQARISRAPTDAQALVVEALEGVRKALLERWDGGYPQEVVNDILDNVLNPAIEAAQAAQKVA